MSVERNYTFRIPATADDTGPQAEKRKFADAAPEKSTDEGINPSRASDQEPSGNVDEFRSAASGAVQLSRTDLLRETDDISAAEKPERIASQSAFSGPSEKQQAFSDEAAAAIAGKANTHGSPESSGMPAVPDAEVGAELAEQVRKLHSSIRARAINHQESAETLSIIRHIRDMFLEQQRESVTRQELRRELQALRLVMEGRK